MQRWLNSPVARRILRAVASLSLCALMMFSAAAFAEGEAMQIEEDALPINTVDLTVPANDVWQRLRNGFSMPNLNSPLVADRQAFYLNRPELMKLMTARSRRYLYYIVTELEKRGMPTELALLPMVESSQPACLFTGTRTRHLAIHPVDRQALWTRAELVSG